MKHILFVLITGIILFFAFMHYPSKQTSDSERMIRNPLQDLSGLPNTMWLEEDLIGSGKPGASDLAMAAQSGVKSIIDLRHPDEDITTQKTLTRQYGMQYYNIPVTYDTLGESQVMSLKEIIDNPENRPAIMHCKSGGRVKKLWELYKKSSE